MRSIVLLAVLMIAAIAAAGDNFTAQAKSLRLPVNPADELITNHPIVGDWVESTAAGAVPASFEADGSLVIQFPDTALGTMGNSFVGAGYGTWEPVGQGGVLYTVVRTVSHANGIHLGSITIQGYLTLSEDGLTYTDDGQLTIITHRDPRNLISSVTGVGDNVEPIVASRVAVGQAMAPSYITTVAGASENAPKTVVVRDGIGQTGIAHEPVAQGNTDEVPQGGCNTCR